MRIAISQKKKGWAGQAAHAWDLAMGLRERGHEVFLITQPGSAFCQKAKEAGLAVCEIPFYGLRQIPAAFKMARFLKQNRVELIHCHDSKDHQLACFAGREAGVRALVRTKHNTHPLRNALSKLLYRQRTSHLISVSEAVKRSLIASGISPWKITTVYNFVDTDRFVPREPSESLRRALSIPPGFHVVGTVGRLHESKGITDLIKAVPLVLKKQPRVRFLFVGSQPEQWRPAVEAARAQEHCIFTGRVSNVADYLNLLDVAVFPSHRDAFPLAVLEAMAVRRAVIATRVGGIPEVVQDGETGILVDAHRPDELAKVIIEVLERPGLRARLAANGYSAARNIFTREKCLEGIEHVYNIALARRR